MTLAEILLLALALAVDAFTVGTAVGLDHRSPRQRFRLSYHFGLFQALLPLAGILAGQAVESLVRSFAPWIAFALLALVGGRMVYSSFSKEAGTRRDRDLTRGWSLVILSLAVSIDALAVGFTLGVTGGPYVLAVVVIGLVAAALTLVGMLVASRVGRLLGKRCELLAGLVLLGIGVKILAAALLAA